MRVRAFEDVLLPYMCDPRHADDTLFLVCEEDFRLFEKDQPSQAALLWAEAEAGPLSQSPGPGASSSARPSNDEPTETIYKESLKADWRARSVAAFEAQRQEGVSPSPSDPPPPPQPWFDRTTKATKADFEHPSQYLVDLVRLCTAAHRLQRGHMVWLTWDGDTGKKVKTHPSHGSMLLGVSWMGATWLQDNWNQIWRSHFDLSLKWVCENMSQDLEASFCYPSCGHYVSHGSGILLAERKAVWREWWVQEGVRKPAEQGRGVHRQIWGWSKVAGQKGVKTDCLEEVDLATLDCELDWKTYFEPDPATEVPPEPIAGGHAAGASSSAAAEAAPRTWTQEEMRRAFHQQRMVGEAEATSKRQRRIRRSQLLESGHRIFTTDVVQADSFRFQLDTNPWGSLILILVCFSRLTLSALAT